LFIDITSGNKVGWGGRTKASLGAPSPQMGSGHFPYGNSTPSAYFSEMFIVDAKGKSYRQ